MSYRKSKKAISPLIASVLLIVVVVGIGAVVTGIVRNYVTENKQTIIEKSSDMKCGTEIGLEIPVVAEQMRICKNATTRVLNFTMQNVGSATIDDLQIKVFGTLDFFANDTVVTETPTTVSGFTVGDTKKFTVTYTDVGTLQEVKLIPRVKVVGRTDKAYCTDSGLTFADISDC